MNRKIMAGILSVIITGSFALPVYGSSSSRQDTTTLTATIDSSYVLTIPMDTPVSYGTVDTDLSGALKVIGNVRSSQQVTVSATTEQFKNDDGQAEFTYMLLDKSKDIPFSKGVWNEAELRNSQPKEIPLAIHIPQDTWNKAKAGTYKSTVTFTAELENVQP